VRLLANPLVFYIPTHTRIALLRSCLSHYADAKASSPRKALAAALGLGVITIERWDLLKNHIGDENLEKLLELALRVVPERAREILLKDLEKHRELLEAYLKGP